ncbi:hypothetical protein BJV82DRAFT_628746 [Fennellomyces sp. T-0311]|nr:hypothetical protein BJV82DRAFT_628746 [Fennellomyces sp. T-0311]
MPRNKGNKGNKSNKGQKFQDRPLEKITDDPRFAHVHNDPRFKRPRRKDAKVTIDDRFSSMLKSSEFAEKPKVDRYGRRVAPQTAEEELKRFYDIDEDEESGDEEEQTLEELERELAADEGNLEDENIPLIKKKSRRAGYDPMRGKGVIDSSDESTTDEEEGLSDEESEEEVQIPTGDPTYRIAAVNMDWDKIRAVDILKVMNTFKPTTAVVKSVTIYPSEFGKERMAREEVEGPPKELFEKEGSGKDTKFNENDEEKDEDFDQIALRKYQLDRLKYYFAVIEFDSVETAQTVYQACDGNEYEASANFFDLRYIPDDMTFDEEPKEVCTYAPEDYKPSNFSTDALQHTKVKLTWDMDDNHRLEMTRRNFTEDDIRDLDFAAYLASSDEDDDDFDDEDVDALREKYRKLLENVEDSAFNNRSHEEEGDMEITFTPGLTEAAADAVNKRLNVEEVKEETSVETYMRKQREKRQAKKERRLAEREAAEAGSDEEGMTRAFIVLLTWRLF